MDTAERKLYYISDIHLELYDVSNQLNFNLNNSFENYLALCGDIGCPFEKNYETFLAEQSIKFKRVFIIAGNHEYYNKINYSTEGIFSSMANVKYRTMKETEDKIRQICSKYHNLTFLTTNESFLLSDTLFIGCPLWTEVDENAEKYMNDYQKIFISPYCGDTNLQKRDYEQRKIRYMDILQLHGEMKDYLEKKILDASNDLNDFSKQSNTKQIIVLTHHAPSFLMTREDSKSIYYASNCESLFVPPVKCWISGHTHECKDLNINGINCVSNCMGYKTETTNFDINRFITF
jgi:predicted phosphodiesterase